MAEKCFQEEETKVEKDSLSLLEENKPLILLGHLGSSHFSALRTEGSKFKTKNFLFVHQSEDGNGFDIGFTISKKFGPAFMRNKVRRQIKESFRKFFFEHNISCSKKVLVNVVVLTQSKEKKLDFSDVYNQINKFMQHQEHLKAYSIDTD